MPDAPPLRLDLPDDERWWGGRTVDGHLAPFGADTAYATDLLDTGGNQCMPLLVSSHGRVVWSEQPFRFAFDGAGTLTAEPSEAVAALRPGAAVHLEEAGSTLADAFGFARRRVFRPSGRIPAERFFTHPQYNLWIELLYEPTQEKVQAYADRLLAAGFPPGVLMIDDNWSKDYGDWDFKPDAFPDPRGMIDRLHAQGFPVTLWVCPFVSPDGRRYLDLRDDGLLLREASGEPAIRRWWNGHSALVDPRDAAGRAWFLRQLRNLQERYGVDGFKIDAGDSTDYRADDLATDGPALPTDQTHAFATLGEEFDYNEVKAAFGNAGSPLVQRLRDKHHDWSDDAGVPSLIPGTLTQAMTGHAFTCPDMIGGGEYLQFTASADAIDPELFVRSAQVAACTPMMQFSAAPWRLLDAEHADLCRAAAELHVELGPRILGLARHAARTGEPIVRPLEYHFPHAGLAGVTDQFLLGDDLLMAPVSTPGTGERVVRLPEGTWTDDRGERHIGPAEVVVEAPLDRIPRFERG